MADVWVSQQNSVASLLQTTECTYNNISGPDVPFFVSIPKPSPIPGVRFAHPAEASIAEILTNHGIAWQYEPTTFSLVARNPGERTQGFTPDFFLPEHEVYIEMTTMRQSLVTRKNRKFRLMRERYPELNVKLLYRKDVELIVAHHGGIPRGWKAIGPEPFIRASQLEKRARDCANQLSQDGLARCVLVCVDADAEGFRDLIRRELEFRGQSVESGALIGVGTSRPAISTEDGIWSPEPGATVVLVAGIVSTGISLWRARRALREIHAGDPRIVAMLSRQGARLLDTVLSFTAFTVPSEWYVGAGLGVNPGQRAIPDLFPVQQPPGN